MAPGVWAQMQNADITVRPPRKSMSRRARPHTARAPPKTKPATHPAPVGHPLVPALARLDSRARVSHRGVSEWHGVASRPSPCGVPSVCLCGLSLLPRLLGARVQYSMRPSAQYEFAHATRCAQGDSASLNTIASAFPPLWGAHSPSGGRTLGKPRPPSGVSARCVAEKRGRRAHIARAPAASFDPLNRPPAPHPNHHTAFYLV